MTTRGDVIKLGESEVQITITGPRLRREALRSALEEMSRGLLCECPHHDGMEGGESCTDCNCGDR